MNKLINEFDKIIWWPKKPSIKKIIINWLSNKFQGEIKYSEKEVNEILLRKEEYKNVNIRGLMGMATFTNNNNQIKEEFDYLSNIYNKYKDLNTLSIGMSGDYKIAINCGSTMVRIGSTIFGARNY